jgi:hypothetical protein
MKFVRIASFIAGASLLLAGCSNAPSTSSEEIAGKSDKQVAIENVCQFVTSIQVRDVYGVEKALSRLVQIDGSYMPLLGEMANYISVSSGPTGYPKKYPDLQLIKSFCSPTRE